MRRGARTAGHHPTQLNSVIAQPARSLWRHSAKVIELAESNSDLPAVFAEVVTAARAMRHDCRAALFLHDPVRAVLTLGTNSGVPEPYMAAVEGFDVGPEQPSCGRVAFITAEVIVPDVTLDPRWGPYLDVALSNDIRAVWSFPLLDGKDVLGTLAVYHATPQAPTDAEGEALRYLARLAAAAITFALRRAGAITSAPPNARKGNLPPAGKRSGEGIESLRQFFSATRG